MRSVKTLERASVWTLRIIILALIMHALLYLGWVTALGEPAGFPLDDAWIHQTFARNLARLGQMAYNPGEPTAGSTAPLWTLLLVPGHLLAPIIGDTSIPQLWSYLWGLASLGGTAWLTFLIAKRGVQSAESNARYTYPVFWIPYFPFRILFPSVAALLVILDWHLVWAALSGMETAFFTSLALLLVYLTVRGHPPILSGLVAGLLALTRPEGLFLAILCWLEMIRMAAFRNSQSAIRRLKSAIPDVLIFPLILIAVLSPYVAFTWSVAGRLLPNTFYAKTVSYTLPPGLLPILEYLEQVLLVLSLGPFGLLLPALAVAARRRLPSQGWWLLWAWPLGLIALYAWRLPTIYQHGRYLMPALPFFILLGCWGLMVSPGKERLHLACRFYKVLLVGLTLFSWIYGARLYAWDVHFINRIQVQAALWLQANTEPEALVATHDIGAIGYFSGRRLLDTAGLITPEVIPLLRDQPHLLAYLQERHVNYVAQFPRWFPYISQALADREVYRYHDEQVIAAGGDDFVIYKTGW